MILLQVKTEETTPYKLGYELGQFIGHNPIISSIIGVLFLSALIYFTVKIIKKFRNFGE